MKIFAISLEESKEKPKTIMRVYSNESLDKLEVDELTSSKEVLIFSKRYALTGKISIQDFSTGDSIKIENAETLYEVAQAEVEPLPNAEMRYCPFQKGYMLKS